MYLDLDNFKSVNDTLGHLYGDQLLRQIAEKIKEVLPNNLLLFRFGGDEFVIMFPNIFDKYDVAVIAERILHVWGISSMEALVRWNHPDKGILTPDFFINIAEETGLVVKIDQWVLKNVCRQLNEWRKRGCGLLPVAVNLSARQFESSSFVEMLNETIEESALPPGSLEFEITEITAIKDLEATVRILNELKENGFKISLDDFGTGYSSLNYLRLLPIDTLKIDRSFIRDITDNIEKRVITEAVVSLAHKMNLTVVAEGVETKEQFYFLREHNCDKMQGFLFSKALTPQNMEQTMLNYEDRPWCFDHT